MMEGTPQQHNNTTPSKTANMIDFSIHSNRQTRQDGSYKKQLYKLVTFDMMNTRYNAKIPYILIKNAKMQTERCIVASLNVSSCMAIWQSDNLTR